MGRHHRARADDHQLIKTILRLLQCGSYRIESLESKISSRICEAERASEKNRLGGNSIAGPNPERWKGIELSPKSGDKRSQEPSNSENCRSKYINTVRPSLVEIDMVAVNFRAWMVKIS